MNTLAHAFYIFRYDTDAALYAIDDAVLQHR